MTALMCPLCSKSRFDNLDSLRGRLVQAATQNITCPICSEVLLGLDKFTIHLFGHTIPETPKSAEPTTQSTVNMDDLSFLTSWENCWRPNQETTKVELRPKEVINELFLEIKSEESYPRDKRPSINNIKPINEFPPQNSSTSSHLPQHQNQAVGKFVEIRQTNSPTLDSPTFLFEGDNSLVLTPSPIHEDNDSSQEKRNNVEVRELSQYMAGLLRHETINIPGEQQQSLNSMVQSEEKMTQFLKQQAPIEENKQNWEQCINISKLQKKDVSCSAQSQGKKTSSPQESISTLLTPQFLVLMQQSDSKTNGPIQQNLKKTQDKNLENKNAAYSCTDCGKSFRMRGSLVVHTRVAHAGKALEALSEPRNYHCSICSKAFKKEQHLAQHIKTHDGKQWQCETCAKFFTTKYFLKKHQRLHTGEMPYCCETCGKTFTFQQSYHKHLLYHSADKPHECRECGRSFKELSTLHNHQRIHSGEKPFACETCGKCFRQRVSYIVHQRIHTGVLPYQCTACLKKFRYKVSQRSHKCTAQPPGIVVRQPGDLIQRLLEQRRLLQFPE